MAPAHRLVEPDIKHTSRIVFVANIRSQIKRNRQNERRRLKNKSVRSELRTRTKHALSAAEAGAEDSAEALRAAVARIDKAAAKGVIHKNQASNRKSRLMRKFAALESAAQ
jgi:small subunit ribosomal protein S20